MMMGTCEDCGTDVVIVERCPRCDLRVCMDCEGEGHGIMNACDSYEDRHSEKGNDDEQG